MVTCELCGKQVKTTQALRGHKTFIHRITGATGKHPVTRLATEYQLNGVEERLYKLEYVAEPRNSDSHGDVEDTKLRLVDVLMNVNKLLTELSGTVSRLSVIIESTRTSLKVIESNTRYLDEQRVKMTGSLDQYTELLEHLGRQVTENHRNMEAGLDRITQFIDAHRHNIAGNICFDNLTTAERFDSLVEGVIARRGNLPENDILKHEPRNPQGWHKLDNLGLWVKNEKTSALTNTN